MKRYLITYIVFSAFTALNYAYAEEIKTTTSIAMDLQTTKNKSTLTNKQNKSLIHHSLSPLYKHNSHSKHNNTPPKLTPTNTQKPIEDNDKNKNTTSVDFGPYMRELQRRIKMNWEPPKDNKSKTVIVLFTIAKDGRLLSNKIYKSSEDKDADDAALLAVKLTAPFKPLPDEFKGESVDIQFTFDYNIINK